MEITTFGAVMKFAMEREGDVQAALDEAARNTNLSSLHGRIGELTTQVKKNIKFLERARRENINEMVLEPISGLEEKDYFFRVPSVNDISGEEFNRFLEESNNRIVAFYNDAARELPVDEVKRLFERLAKKRGSE